MTLLEKTITYIDLFAGAGGLSEGFVREGYLPTAHIERDKNACSTLSTRIAYHYLKNQNKLQVYDNYLRKSINRNELYAQIPKELINTVINHEISEISLSSIFNTINQNLEDNHQNKVDLIIGGPPCQAYSIAGRARIRDEDQKNKDPRRFLYKLYIQFLAEYKPKVFLFENVPGILSAKDIDKRLFIEKMREDFDENGYIMQHQILNATDYGVLQNRNRVFIIGWLKNLNLSYPKFPKISIPNANVSTDLLNDLPKLNAGQYWDSYKYLTKPSEYLSKFEIRNENDLLTWHISRPNNQNDLEIYQLAIKKWFDEKKRLLYTDLPERLKTQKNQDSFLNRFSVVEGNMPSTHTMVAHIAQDGHYYIHPDIKQLRSITVREAARIQSFPDNYFFEGYRTNAFTQIGNAVPPLVAQTIAKKLKEIL